MPTVFQIKQGMGPSKREMAISLHEGSEVEFVFDDESSIWLAISVLREVGIQFNIVAFAMKEQKGHDYNGKYVIVYNPLTMTGTCTCYSLEEQAEAMDRELASTN